MGYFWKVLHNYSLTKLAQILGNFCAILKTSLFMYKLLWLLFEQLWWKLGTSKFGQCDQIGQFIELWRTNFLKPFATLNLSKSPTFLGNFCKGVKIYHFSCKIIFGQILLTFGDFFLVTLHLVHRRLKKLTAYWPGPPAFVDSRSYVANCIKTHFGQCIDLPPESVPWLYAVAATVNYGQWVVYFIN